MKNAQGTSAFHFLPLTLRLLLSFAPIHRTTLFHSDCGESLGLSSFIFLWHTALMSGELKKTALQLMRVQRSSFDFEKDLIMLQQVLQRFQLLLLQLLHLQRLQLQPVLQPMQLSFPSRAQQFCR